MKALIVLLIGVMPLFSFASVVLAEDTKAKNTAPSFVLDKKIITGAWQESILDLKKSAEVLLEENDNLTSENKQLFDTLSQLQKSIEEIKKEGTQLKDEPSRLNKLIDIESSKGKVFEKQAKDLEKKIMPLEKEKTLLEQKLSRLEEKQKPLENELNALMAKKTNLEVDLKLKEASLPVEAIEKLKAEIVDIQQLLSQNQSQEEEIKKAMTKAKASQEASALQASDDIKKENEVLMNELSKMRNEQRIVLRDIETLKKDNKGFQGSNVDAFSKKLTEKTNLEAESNRLGSKILHLRQRITDPVAVTPDVKREDLDSTMSTLEKENQDLEQRIFDLNEAVLVLKRENTMIEALLNVQNAVASIDPASRLREGVVQSRTVAEAMGYAYATQGMYSQAIEQYQMALKQGENKKDIYFNLGYVYFKMGNIDEATKCYKNVLKIDPHDYEAKRNIAKLHEELSQSKEHIRKTED